MLAQFLQQQLDYIYFFYGYAFVLLAGVCATIRHNSYRRLPWIWLGLFGLTHGLNEWLDLLALSLGDSGIFAIVRLGLMTLSFLFLTEFARDGWRRLEGKAPGRWMHLPLLALFCCGGLAGMPGLNAAARYTFGLIGGIWTALTLLRLSKTAVSERAILITAAGIMAGYAVAAGAVVSQAPFFPASVANAAVFLSLTGIPIQLIRGVLAVLLALVIWWYYQKSDCPLAPARGRESCAVKILTIPLLLLALLAAGWMLTESAGHQTDRKTREAMLRDTSVIAAAIDPEQIKSLTGTPQDLMLPAYDFLRRQLLRLDEEASHLHQLYLMLLKDGAIVFAIDSLPETDPLHTKPGVNYRKPPKELNRIFVTGQAATVGPYEDEYGVFLSGFAPIRTSAAGQPLAVLGVDMNAETWQKAVADARLIPIGAVFFTAVLLVLFLVVRQRNREAAQKTAESEERLAKAQEVARLGSWELQLSTRTLIWSKQIYAIFEMDPDKLEASEDRYLNLVHPDDRETVNQTYTTSVEIKTPYEIDYRLQFPDGRIKHVREHGETFYSPAGEPLRSVGTIQDVTERKKAEEQLARYAVELEQRNAELDAYAHIVAHDLKTPLFSVVGYADLALDEKLPASDRLQYVQRIGTIGSKMEEIINNLLLLAGARGADVALEMLEMHSIVSATLARFDLTIRKSGATLALPGSWPEACGYAPWVEEVWANYISNAIKYGGHPPQIDLGASEAGATHVRFWVRDHGQGIPAEKIKQLFLPFKRLVGSGGDGSGIGLFVVKKIITRLGGEVYASSIPDQGSVFEFTLPKRLHKALPRSS